MRFWKTTIVIALFIGAPISSFSYWYVIRTADFNRIEQSNTSTTITLAVRSAAAAPYYIQRADVSSTNKCNQINFTPPVGKENMWLSMLLTAVASGQDLTIAGDCDEPSGQVNVDGRNGGRLTLGN
jgi:hypothetical protein